MNISLKRHSQDKITDRLGRNLVEFCKADELVILNGK